MTDDPENILTPGVRNPSATPGDIPAHMRRRYLSDPHGGPGLGFYVDATVSVAAFRDHGARLTASRTEPSVIRDLVAIARHRGWAIVAVRGAADFRREAWMAGRAAGLEVRGYRPTERDLQALARRLEARTRPPEAAPPDPEPRRQTLDASGPRTRLRIIEAVVRDRLVEPGDQARILAAARGRIADWLDRGARFDELRAPPERRSPGRSRAR
jgi:hypothetical protein